MKSRCKALDTIIGGLLAGFTGRLNMEMNRRFQFEGFGEFPKKCAGYILCAPAQLCLVLTNQKVPCIIF
jgi:hypothetical protein